MYYIEVCVGGASPENVFEKSLLRKKEHEAPVADNLTAETQARMPAWVKYRFVDILRFIGKIIHNFAYYTPHRAKLATTTLGAEPLKLAA